ncbi:unnamed protein product [Trichobilharzia regenti]|nr:unnamed protein product [Trichobilharzia regenti]
MLRQLIKDERIIATTKLYAQGLDAGVRCRPDGYLADDDYNDLRDDTLSSNSIRQSVQMTNGGDGSDGNNLDPSEQISEKTVVCGMYGWVPAHRVVQIRWTVSELLGINSTAISSSSSSSNAYDNKDSMNVKGQEVNVGCLIDKLGYNNGMFLDYTNLALRCVDILHRLCASCSSRDIHGGVVRPLPKPRRAISDVSCLPHLIQVGLFYVLCMCVYVVK